MHATARIYQLFSMSPVGFHSSEGTFLINKRSLFTVEHVNSLSMFWRYFTMNYLTDSSLLV